MQSEITPAMPVTAAPKARGRLRLDEIDVMKGMAIFLVVLGHVVSHGDYPQGNPWYWDLQYWIYNFHMPLFMYLTGLTFFLFQKPFASLADYFRFLSQRALRLLPALFAVGIAAVVAKTLVSGWLHVDNPANDFWGAIFKLFYDPWGGALRSVWFVYALFVIYLGVGPILIATKWNPYPLVALGAILHFIPLTDYFCLSRVGEYAFMFALGCIAAPHYQKISAVATRFFAPFLLLFIGVSASIYLPWDGDWKKIAVSLASLPVAHGLAMRVRGRWTRVLSILGVATFIIYLTNTFFIAIAKALLLKLHAWDGAAFLLFAPIMVAAGTLGPILLKSQVLKKNRTLDRLTG